MKIDVLKMIDVKKVVVEQETINDPGFGEIQVEIKACGVCAWDSYLFKGKSLVEEHPFKFGHEGAGIVTKIGPGVDNFKIGDKVFCAGGAHMMAEVINIPAINTAKIPADVEDFSLWVGEPIACVVNGIDQMNITPGDNVVVIGSGYMGLLNIQALAHSLIGDLIAFDIDDSRLKLAKEYGADQVYNVNSEEGKKAIERIKENGGVELVVEASSSQPGLDLATSLLHAAGKMSLFAWHRGTREIDGTAWHLNGLRIVNTAPGSDKHFTDRIPQTATLMKKGVFNQEKLITHVMDYHKAQEMLELSISKEDGYIKGVLTF